MQDILKATAIYSGGGIYLYYAEQEDGNWIIGSDEGLSIVNTNPLCDEKTFEESNYPEWQTEHLVKDISDIEFPDYLCRLLSTIFMGHTIPEYDNFAFEDLEKRYII